MLAAIVGGVGALLLVRWLAVAFELVRYPLSHWKDREWEAQIGATKDESILFAELVCRVHPPIDAKMALGYMECLVIDPNCQETRIPGDFLSAQYDPPGVSGKYQTGGVVGEYEFRWYASNKRRKLYEITRRRFNVGTGDLAL